MMVKLRLSSRVVGVRMTKKRFGITDQWISKSWDYFVQHSHYRNKFFHKSDKLWIKTVSFVLWYSPTRFLHIGTHLKCPSNPRWSPNFLIFHCSTSTKILWHRFDDCSLCHESRLYFWCSMNAETIRRKCVCPSVCMSAPLCVLIRLSSHAPLEIWHNTATMTKQFFSKWADAPDNICSVSRGGKSRMDNFEFSCD